FAKGIDHLVSIAHAHLRNALEYTLLIPRGESGLRRFCLWSIGLALLTLGRIHQNPIFSNSAQVKVARKTVRATVMVTSACSYSNSALRLLFNTAARGLPRAYGFPKFASNRLSSDS
ncbi:MAG: phytoene synthase, partial [Gammaproteobacteria bacterium]|nr:phytoene synthase [Gammaproteobacteria bacterium]